MSRASIDHEVKSDFELRNLQGKRWFMIMYNYFEYIDLEYTLQLVSFFYKFLDNESFLKLRVNLESRIVACPFDVSLTRCDGTLRSSSIWNWLFSALKQRAWPMPHSRMRATTKYWCLRTELSTYSASPSTICRYLPKADISISQCDLNLLAWQFNAPKRCFALGFGFWIPRRLSGF
jgi:hypothetical protein